MNLVPLWLRYLIFLEGQILRFPFLKNIAD
jgi:hypothetical protein